MTRSELLADLRSARAEAARSVELLLSFQASGVGSSAANRRLLARHRRHRRALSVAIALVERRPGAR